MTHLEKVTQLFNDAEINQDLGNAVMFWSDKGVKHYHGFFWLQKSYVESQKQEKNIWELVKELGERKGCLTLGFFELC